MERKNAKAKIIISVVVLLSTLAFAALGTFAWFTMSTRGDLTGVTVTSDFSKSLPLQFIEQRDYDEWVSIEDVMNAEGRSSGDKWSKNITLGKVKYKKRGVATESDPRDCYQLRPISTRDLKTWYLPSYSGDGEVVGMMPVDFEAVANINRNMATPSAEGKDYPSNYVYYYDFWVRTPSDDTAYTLHLSNPLNTEDALMNAEMAEEYNYGTFVLPGLVNNGGVTTMSEAGYDMSTCLRIGFGIYDTDPDDISRSTMSEFWIYEPNCDMRAKYFSHYKASGSSYEQQLDYVYVMGNDGIGKTVSNQAAMSEGVIYKTLLPYASGSEIIYGDADSNTIKQLKSTWRDDIDLGELGDDGPDSTCISHFGAFQTEATGKPGLTGIDTPSFATLTKGTPVHIRVFIWMEGQDDDCWNSSLKGSLKIGLEFRGDAVSN